MSYENDIFNTLKSLVGNRVAPVIFRQPTQTPTWPAIRYTFTSVVPVQDLCGDGDDSTADVRVQLDVVALSYEQVRALRLQVMAAMEGFSPPATLEYSNEDYDGESRTYREILQYSIHGSSTSGSP